MHGDGNEGDRGQVDGGIFQGRFHALALAAAALGMTALTWRRWADPLVDFGVELYLPWRIVSGDVLYRDVHHYYAPLSVALNALWFEILGTSYISLVAGNAIVLGGITAALWFLLRRFSSALATTAALLLFLLVFAFSQYIEIGNYNYLSPYSHELTHGLLFALVALIALDRSFRGSRAGLFVAGLLLGVVFLTKYEVTIALGAAIAISLVLWKRGEGSGGRGLAALVVAGAAAVPVFACWAVLNVWLAPVEATRAVLGAYPYMLNPGKGAAEFVRNQAGLARPLTSLGTALLWLAAYGTALLPVAWLGARMPDGYGRSLRVAAVVIPPLLFLAAQDSLGWTTALTPLPFILAAVLLVNLRRPKERSDARGMLAFAFAAFSLLMHLKTPLWASVHHYGFALSMPGTLLLVALLADRGPSWAERRGLNRALFRASLASLLACFVLFHLLINIRTRALRTHPLADGADLLYVDRFRGKAVREALDVVESEVAEGKTLAVLPEGAMLNYLARRPSSVSHLLFHPTPLAWYGEQKLVAELRASPPDFVLFFSPRVRSLEEFGCRQFGRDCAPLIGRWLASNYRLRETRTAYDRSLFVLLEKAESRGQKAEVDPAAANRRVRRSGLLPVLPHAISNRR